MRAVQHWEHYLLGIPFEWHTDHRNLTYFMEKQDLTSRQHRWSQVISQYNYTPHHREGKKMYLTDPMSRQIQHKVDEGNDMENQQIQIIFPEFIKATRSYVTIAKDKDLLDRIRASSQIDDTLKEAVTKVKSSKHLTGKDVIPEWEMVDGLLWYKGFISPKQYYTVMRHNKAIS